jgi:hypothetical protein
VNNGWSLSAHSAAQRLPSPHSLGNDVFGEFIDTSDQDHPHSGHTGSSPQIPNVKTEDTTYELLRLGVWKKSQAGMRCSTKHQAGNGKAIRTLQINHGSLSPPQTRRLEWPAISDGSSDGLFFLYLLLASLFSFPVLCLSPAQLSFGCLVPPLVDLVGFRRCAHSLFLYLLSDDEVRVKDGASPNQIGWTQMSPTSITFVYNSSWSNSVTELGRMISIVCGLVELARHASCDWKVGPQQFDV